MSKMQRTLLVCDVFCEFGERMLGPLFAILATKLGGDLMDVAGAAGVCYLALGLSTIAVGFLTDRYKVNLKYLLLCGYFGGALMTLMYLVITSPWQLFVLQAVMGVLASFGAVAWNAMYSSHCEDTNQGSSWGLACGMSRTTIGISILTGGVIVSMLSFTALFICMSIIQSLAGIYLIFRTRKEGSIYA